MRIYDSEFSTEVDEQANPMDVSVPLIGSSIQNLLGI